MSLDWLFGFVVGLIVGVLLGLFLCRLLQSNDTKDEQDAAHEQSNDDQVSVQQQISQQGKPDDWKSTVSSGGVDDPRDPPA